MKVQSSQSIDVTWTDGGRPESTGYFDGAGDLSQLFASMFAGEREDIPVGADVMGRIPYGTKCRLTFTIETDPSGPINEPLVQSIERLQLQEGDVIVLRSMQFLSPNAVCQIKEFIEGIRHTLGLVKLEAMVLDGGIQLSVLSAAEIQRLLSPPDSV